MAAYIIFVVVSVCVTFHSALPPPPIVQITSNLLLKWESITLITWMMTWKSTTFLTSCTLLIWLNCLSLSVHSHVWCWFSIKHIIIYWGFYPSFVRLHALNKQTLENVSSKTCRVVRRMRRMSELALGRSFVRRQKSYVHKKRNWR